MCCILQIILNEKQAMFMYMKLVSKCIRWPNDKT